MNRAVFFDRDGTINYDPGYLKDPESVRLFEGVGSALRKLKKETGALLFVASNQSGIDRGLMTVDDVESVNKKISEIIALDGAQIDYYYYCPHLPNYVPQSGYNLRKPEPGMLFLARDEYNIELQSSYMVGDSEVDMIAGINAGVKTCLVLTGNGETSRKKLSEQGIVPDFIANSVVEACDFIINDVSRF